MNKIFKILLGALLLSLLYQIIVATVFSTKGYDITWQTRFTKKVGTKTKINIPGFFSPVQGVATKKITEKSSFVEKVVYPKAPTFNLVLPDENAEKIVGQKIAQVIKDSIKRINYDNSLNYDGSSFAVFFAHVPSLPKLAHQKINLRLIGTASSEAKKYGYEQSLKVGSLEPENQKLAEKRLARTRKNIEESFAGDLHITDTAYEVQLAHDSLVSKVISNPTLLDKDRYVEAQVSIASEKIEVIPFPSPWLLFVLLGLLSFLKKRNFSFPSFRTKPVSNQDIFLESRKFFFDRMWVKYIGLVLVLLILALIIFYLWGLFIALCLVVVGLFALCFFFGETCKKRLVVWWLSFRILLKRIWDFLIKVPRCKIILFLLILFIIIARMCGWWYWNGW